jgi:hypothetical protein
MPDPELMDQALKREDLPHRDRMDPKEGPPPSPDGKPDSQTLGQMQALAFSEAEPDEIKGNDGGQSKPEQHGIKKIHSFTTIL